MSDLLHERAVREATRDWRYKAGIEDGRRQENSETRRVEAQRDLALIELYKLDPAACAELCDERLDRRGGLLGRVRQWVVEDGS